MNDRELVSALKAGETEPVYVFAGKEAYLREDALARLRKRLVPEELSDFNCTELTNPAVQDIISCAETLPMLADRRLVIVREFAPLSGGDKKGRTADQTKGEGPDGESEALLQYLPKAPDTACIVFLAGETLDKRKKLGKTMAALPGFVSFDPPDDAELVRFLAKIAERAGLSIDRTAAERLIFFSGRDLSALSREMEKLIAYAGNEGRILPEHVYAVATRTPEARVFDMIDAAALGDRQKALDHYSDLLALKQPPMRSLYLTAQQYNRMLAAKELLAEGNAPPQIAQKLGIKPYAAKKLTGMAGRFSRSDLLKAVRTCVRLEEAVKTGNMNDRLSVEMILLGTAQHTKRP